LTTAPSAIDLAPKPLRGAARLAMSWMTRDLQYATRRADAILGVTDEFVQWGLHAAEREASDSDRAFAMAYAARMPAAADLARADEWWDARGISAAEGRFIVCFFGTLGWMFDFDTVLAAATRLASAAPEVTFVICGAGERLEALRQRAAGLRNVVLPGRVGAAEVHSLMRRASAGLAPYRPFRNFHDNLPNKPVEYLSAGLPVVATRLGVLARLLADHQCGLSYDHGDDCGLADAIQTLSRNAPVQSAMAQRAEALYREEFVAERVYDRMAVHLETLAALYEDGRRRPGGVGADTLVHSGR
jgi:glycosyltransferase involved in cell wall biosynthesis